MLPAYNEAERIGSALDELFGYLNRAGPARDGGRPASDMGPVDVLVVDDGSTDGTAAIVNARTETHNSANGTLRLMIREHAGKGAAVRAGMLEGKGDYVLFADADLATPPDQLPLLTDALKDHDIALGSRVHPDGTDRRATQPLHRRLLGRVFHSLAAFWVTGPVPDTQCGFKGFRARPRMTSSRARRSAASSSTPRSSISPASAATRSRSCPCNGRTSAARACACARARAGRRLRPVPHPAHPPSRPTPLIGRCRPTLR